MNHDSYGHLQVHPRMHYDCDSRIWRKEKSISAEQQSLRRTCSSTDVNCRPAAGVTRGCVQLMVTSVTMVAAVAVHTTNNGPSPCLD